MCVKYYSVTDVQLLPQNNVEDQFTPLYVEFIMSLADPDIDSTNGNTPISITSGSVLRVIDDNFTSVCVCITTYH